MSSASRDSIRAAIISSFRSATAATATRWCRYRSSLVLPAEFKAVMPDSVFFYPGDAFHIGSLGVMSHGCIHLSPSAAATFFNTLQVGDEVQIVQG